MEEVDLEKEELLASIRLQDKALSVSITDTPDIISCDSDSDGDRDIHIKPDISNIQEVLDADAETCGENKLSTWSDALTANIEYDEALARVEQDIKQSIERVDKELQFVREKISRLSSEVSVFSSRSLWTYIFGMPYFKDGNMYPCPPNEDYNTKKRNHEICWSELPSFHQWVPKLKRNLVGAIKKLSLKKCESKAKSKLAGLQKELEVAKQAQNDTRVKVLEAQVVNFNVDEEAKSMLQETIENDEHDWMQISAKYLNGRQSPEGCRSFWQVYLHPKINKGPWTKNEENSLKKIAKKHHLEDWESIAAELGTKRSGYQCFIVYQTKLNDSLKRSVWTVEEDERLMSVVEKCRLGDYIPWGKVAFNMDGRTKAQVFNRWTYCLNPSIKKGRFTTAEDIMVLVGVNMWGEDFQRIANFMKDRTTIQVRDHYKNYLNRGNINIPWELEDDERLMALVKTHGRNWAKISQHFPSRNRTQVRHRFNTIEKWQQGNPNVPLSEATPIRRLNTRSSKDFSLHWEKARAILSCETIDEMVEAKEKLVSSLQSSRKIFKPMKKKTSIIEGDLINYFRCSYDIPGGRRRFQLRAGEAARYADEIIDLTRILNVKLHLPSMEEIESDSSLTFADKDILSAVILKTNACVKESSPESPGILLNDMTTVYSDDLVSTAGTSSVQSDSLWHPSTSSIDYVQPQTTSSVYVDLPLLNFHNDEVVVERKNMNVDVTVKNPQNDRTMDFLFVSTSSTDLENVAPKKLSESFVCPPNFTNLVGLRTYLLNRRTLLEYCNKSAYVCKFSEVVDQNFKTALDLFNSRLLSLFLWPALMSRTAPSNSQIFFEDGEKAPRWNTGVFSPMKRKAEAETTGNIRKKCKPNSLRIPSNADQTVSEPKNSKCSKKQQILCPTSGNFVLVSELEDLHSSGSGNGNADDGEEGNCREEESFSQVMLIDAAEEPSNKSTDNSKVLLSDILKDKSLGAPAYDTSQENSENGQLLKHSGEVQIYEIKKNSFVGMNFCEVSGNNSLCLSGPFLSEGMNTCDTFTSEPDFALESKHAVLVKDCYSSTLPNPHIREVPSLEFTSANPCVSEVKSLAGLSGNVSMLGPATGKMISNPDHSMAYVVENSVKDLSDIDLC